MKETLVQAKINTALGLALFGYQLSEESTSFEVRYKLYALETLTPIQSPFSHLKELLNSDWESVEFSIDHFVNEEGFKCIITQLFDPKNHQVLVSRWEVQDSNQQYILSDNGWIDIDIFYSYQFKEVASI